MRRYIRSNGVMPVASRNGSESATEPYSLWALFGSCEANSTECDLVPVTEIILDTAPNEGRNDRMLYRPHLGCKKEMGLWTPNPQQAPLPTAENLGLGFRQTGAADDREFWYVGRHAEFLVPGLPRVAPSRRRTRGVGSGTPRQAEHQLRLNGCRFVRRVSPTLPGKSSRGQCRSYWTQSEVEQADIHCPEPLAIKAAQG
jgi:hypothetical protein